MLLLWLAFIFLGITFKSASHIAFCSVYANTLILLPAAVFALLLVMYFPAFISFHFHFQPTYYVLSS